MEREEREGVQRMYVSLCKKRDGSLEFSLSFSLSLLLPYLSCHSLSLPLSLHLLLHMLLPRVHEHVRQPLSVYVTRRHAATLLLNLSFALRHRL